MTDEKKPFFSFSIPLPCEAFVDLVKCESPAKREFHPSFFASPTVKYRVCEDCYQLHQMGSDHVSFGLPISDEQIKEMALEILQEDPKMNQGEIDRDEIVELRKKLLSLISTAEDVLRAYDLDRKKYYDKIIPGSSTTFVDTFETLRRELSTLKGNG